MHQYQSLKDKRMKNEYYIFLVLIVLCTSCTTKDIDAKDISIIRYVRENNSDWLHLEAKIGNDTYAIKDLDYYNSADTMYIKIIPSSKIYSTVNFWLNNNEIDYLLLDIDSTIQYINIQTTKVIPIDSLKSYSWKESSPTRKNF